tara:strand:- start:44 stop:415 length:372 start_codon:yes stop_codon:yes gene_type:complete
MPLTEAQKEAQKKYYEKNKDKKNKYTQEYREKNKELIKEYDKQRCQTKQYKKNNLISEWKRRGVINDDYDKLYDLYINTENCEECNIELVSGNVAKNRRCLDHCHKTGEFRNVLCNTCNIRRG